MNEKKNAKIIFFSAVSIFSFTHTHHIKHTAIEQADDMKWDETTRLVRWDDDREPPTTHDDDDDDEDHDDDDDDDDDDKKNITTNSTMTEGAPRKFKIQKEIWILKFCLWSASEMNTRWLKRWEKYYDDQENDHSWISLMNSDSKWQT